MQLPPWLPLLIMLSAPLALQATPLDLVLNGDFEEDLAVGWFERNDATASTILRTTLAHPDPDYEAQLSVDNGVGELGLVQRFPVPNLDLAISADLKIYADGTGGAWAVGGLMLTYRDRNWAVLGSTAVVYPSRDCPWTDTPTFHVIYTGLDTWQTHGFDLTDELENLPDVDPAAIAWLDVAVMIEAENC